MVLPDRRLSTRWTDGEEKGSDRAPLHARRQSLSISVAEKHIAKATLQLTTWMEGW